MKEFDFSYLPPFCDARKRRRNLHAQTNGNRMDGSFSIPAGGLGSGETIAAAAIREVYEEVGVIIAPENLDYVHILHSKSDDRTWVGHFFRAKVWKGEPTLREPDKHSELQWRPIIALPSQTVPYVQQAIKCVAELKPYSEYGWGS